MKRYTSRVLKSVAVFFMLFPLIYIILVATLFDIPLNTCVGILLSPFYYIVTFSVLATGFGLWEMYRWSWYLLIISQILIGYENAVIVHAYAETHHKVIAYIISLILQIILITRIAQEVRVPYLFPRIRWWESNPRYKLSVPVTITRKSGEVHLGDILDLTMAGCFIKYRPELDPHEKVTIQFNLFGQEVQAEGTVVWCAQSTVTHPKGIGFKFGTLAKPQKRAMRAITKRLKKVATLYRRSRYLMSQEDFLKKLEEIESKGIEAHPEKP